jgi:hypothetical protein
MEEAVATAAGRAGRQLMILGTTDSRYPVLIREFSKPESVPIPETVDGSLLIYRRQ